MSCSYRSCLLYVRQLLFKVVIVGNYSLRFERRELHVVVICHIVKNYCLMFDRREGHVVLVCYFSTTTVRGLTEE